MIRTILTFGAGAGLMLVAPMFATFLFHLIPDAISQTLIFGYLVMLLALTLVFVGIKRIRDREYGGVIRFFPALLIGLGISVVAGLFYVIGWEIVLVATHNAFADTYAASMIEAAHAKGASPEKLARVTAEMAAFKTQYGNPFYRLPMTFVEVFPVGVVVSLIAASLLRNSRFLPAQSLA
jgi:hypothetical protein